MSNSAGGSARWWIARPGQQPEGPFTADEIVARLRAAGGVGDWMGCPEGGAEWTPLTANAQVMAGLNPPAPAPAPVAPPQAPSEPFVPPSAPSTNQGGVPSAAYSGAPVPQPVAGNDNTIPVLIHAGVLAGFIVPFAGFLLPLILWLVNREKPGVDAHGKEVMNWIIFLVIVSVPSFVLVFCYIGICLVALIVVAQLVFGVLGAMKASKGELMRYPMPFRLIK
jgi:uncharacterized Tic20 family protein